MFAEIFKKLSHHQSLDSSEMTAMIEGIVNQGLSELEIERFLVLLREKGETGEEISAAAEALGRHAVALSRSFPDLLDTCGTGGDGLSTFNVSTVSSLVACAAGVPIGKHGNRAVSGKTGSADLLELLGIRVDLPASVWERSIAETGYAFFFAPLFHPAVKQASAARKRIPGKTLFNVLGPLLNPARASRRLMGVYDARLLELLGPALRQNGALEALVVHGQDGMDEISLCAKTHAIHYDLKNGVVARRLEIDPREYGFSLCKLEELVSASPDQSRRDALSVLGGQPGAKSDWTALNAGAAIWISGKAPDLRVGIRLAREILAGRAGLRKLEQIALWTQGAKS